MEDRRGLPDAAFDAAKRVRAAGGSPCVLGVVLGTGLGRLAERLESPVFLPMAASHWLATPTATGHAGRIACGSVGGVPVAMLEGRVHAYEGFDDDTIARGARLLAALGATTLLVTNASGGLRADMAPGEILVVDDHLDFVRRRGGASAAGAPRPTYCPRLVDLALAAARRAGARARPGVYARLLGPSYETRAEYRMLLRFGADVAGMSTVPEVLAARAAGLAVAALSVVTNVARPDAPEATDAGEVCRLASTAAEGVWSVIEEFARDLARRGGGPGVARAREMAR